MRKTIILLSMALLPLLMFTACEKENGSKGTLNLSITDAPLDADGITGVFITVSEIQYHTSENGWQTFTDYEGPKTFDLLELQRGESEMLGSFELESGYYTQIRFLLDAPSSGTGPQSNPGCYLEFMDGTTKNLFVPSGAQTGYKAVGAFSVPTNGSVNVTADFDVRKSVVRAGASGKYILKPTIRLVVDDQAGQIAGEVLNIPKGIGIVVYVYNAGTYEDSEAQDPAEEQTRFPNAVSSDIADQEGIYYLAFLAPGAYDLLVAATIEGEFSEVLGVVGNVIVESGKTTSNPIDLEELQ